MNFDNQISSPQVSSNQSYQQPSFLGGLVQTIADGALQYGEHYAENQVNNWASNL